MSKSKGKITPLVGKPDPVSGGWLTPKPASPPHKELKAILNGYERFQVRVRDLSGLEIPDETTRILGGFLDSLRESGKVKVTLDYGEADRYSNMYLRQSVRTYEVGKVYEVGGGEALRLLNTFPYSLLFEEVEEEPLDKKTVETLDKDAAVAALLEENRRLREEHQAQMALLMERFDRLEQQPVTSSKKKSLKDLEE